MTDFIHWILSVVKIQQPSGSSLTSIFRSTRYTADSPPRLRLVSSTGTQEKWSHLFATDNDVIIYFLPHYHRNGVKRVENSI